MKLIRDNRGAVYVEFILAFLPLAVFFECLVQMSGLITAKLVVDHAASSATRAATIVLHDDPKYYDQEEVGRASGKRRDTIRLAAAMPLRATKSFTKLEINFPSHPKGTDDRVTFGPNDLVRVRVTATYRCQVPIANRIVCNWATGTREIHGEAALPNQGAAYEYGD